LDNPSVVNDVINLLELIGKFESATSHKDA
jgi:hypothetical protein